MAVKVKMSELLPMAMGEDAPITRLSKVKTFKTKTTYRAAKAIKAVMAELQDYEKSRIALCERCGTRNGDKFDIAPEHMEAFQKGLEELMAEEVELDILPVEIDDAEGLTPADMLALEPILVVKD